MTSEVTVVPAGRLDTECVVSLLRASGFHATAGSTGAKGAQVVVVVRPPHDPTPPEPASTSDHKWPLIVLGPRDLESVETSRHVPWGESAEQFLATCRAALVAASETPAGRRAITSGWDQLTPRERVVASLVGEGLQNAEIARALDISFHTARTHVRNVMVKLGASTRHGVAKVVRERSDPPSLGSCRP